MPNGYWVLSMGKESDLQKVSQLIKGDFGEQVGSDS